MFDEKMQKNLVIYSLIADSYSLGVHWVYDEKQLVSNSINWEGLNAPLALWHKGKAAGEFTHYGDQIIWLYEFLKEENSFDEKEYLLYWYENMNLYDGYLDGASRTTMDNIANDISPSGSLSTDLSVVGRIAPLFKVSKTKEELLENVEKFVRVTHNSTKAVTCADFFTKMLLLVSQGKSMEESILFLKNEYDISIQKMIDNAIESKNKNTFEVLRSFGIACDIDDGFAGVLHLVCKYDNLKELLINNAKAGGDTSSRAMIAAMLFVAGNKNINLPQSWFNIKVRID